MSVNVIYSMPGLMVFFYFSKLMIKKFVNEMLAPPWDLHCPHCYSLQTRCVGSDFQMLHCLILKHKPVVILSLNVDCLGREKRVAYTDK